MSQRLNDNNATPYWTAAWTAGRTSWRLGELSRPFTRNIFLALRSLTGQTPETLKNAEFPFRVTKPLHDSGMYNGADEVKAVEEFLKGKTVLVPLCGDTEAVPYMAEHGAAVVVGADLSSEGLQRQMKDNFPGVHFDSREVTVEPKDSADAQTSTVLTIYEATVANGAKVVLFQGDFLAAKDCPDFEALKVDFVYDRSALVAVCPALRDAYVRTIARVIASDAATILIERPVREAGDLDGPPFSLSTTDVARLFDKFTRFHTTCELALVDAWRAPPADAPNMGGVTGFEWLVTTFST